MADLLALFHTESDRLTEVQAGHDEHNNASNKHDLRNKAQLGIG